MGKIADAIRGLGIPEQKKIQMLYLDEEFETSKSQVETLQLENRNLRAEINPLKEQNKQLRGTVETLEQKVERLEKQIKARTTEPKEQSVVHENRDDIEDTFLSYLASVHRQDRTTKNIAASVRNIHPESEMTELKAGVYLKRLQKRDLVEYYPSGYGYSDADEHWELTDRGAEYVVLHKLELSKSSSAPAKERPDNPKGHHCDHCGSTQLKRSGSKRDPTFGDVGIKMALYRCLDCQKESGFTNDE